MKVNVAFAHLHGPLFFAKRNWGEKLDIQNTSKGRITMTYDREAKELHLECEGKESYLPSTSIFSYEPIPASLDAMVEHLSTPSANPLVNPPKGKPGPKPKVTAQVSGPHDHVFAQSPGKTRD